MSFQVAGSNGFELDPSLEYSASFLALSTGFGVDAGVASPGLLGAGIDFNFSAGTYYQAGIGSGTNSASYLTCSRASTGTSLLPTSASGAAYSTFGNNVLRIRPGVGLIAEQASTNYLLNSAVPVTQTTASLTSGYYTLWVNGSGTAAVAGGTGVLTPGTASQGTPYPFALTSSGTVVVTVVGSLNAFQLEPGLFATSFIPTTSGAVTRAEDADTVTTVPSFGSSFSMYVSATPATAVADGFYGLCLISDGTVNNRLLFYHVSGSSTNVLDAVAGVNTSTSGVDWTVNTFGKIASSVNASMLLGAFNGAGMTAGTPSGSPTGLNSIALSDTSAGLLAWGGVISRIAVWPTIMLTQTQLNTVTSGSGP